MKGLITRINNWYKLHCNGDWEHRYGLGLSTLDNPGWLLKIDLTGTALEGLVYNQRHQNERAVHDWYAMQAEKKVFTVACGPDNLEQVITLFFDEIIPKHADSQFIYNLYLPLAGHEFEIWTPAQASFVDEQSLKITAINPLKLYKIRVRDMNLLVHSGEIILENLDLNFKVGDVVNVALESLAGGPTLVAKTNS